MRARIQEQDGLLRVANPPFSRIEQNGNLFNFEISFAYDATFWANNGGSVVVKILPENKPQIGNEFGFDSIPEDLFKNVYGVAVIPVTLGSGLESEIVNLKNGSFISYDYILPPQEIDNENDSRNVSTQFELVEKYIKQNKDPVNLGLGTRKFDDSIDEINDFYIKDGTIYETVSGVFQSKFAIAKRNWRLSESEFINNTVYEFTYVLNGTAISKVNVNISNIISRLIDECNPAFNLPRKFRPFSDISSISILPTSWSDEEPTYGLKRNDFFSIGTIDSGIPIGNVVNTSIIAPSNTVKIPFYVDYQNKQIRLTKNLLLIPGASELEIFFRSPDGLRTLARVSQPINSNEISVLLPNELGNGVEYIIVLVVRTIRQIVYRSSNFLTYKHFSNPLNTVSIRTLEALLQEDGSRQIIAKLNFTDASLSNNDFRCILEKVSLENGTQERNDRTTSIEANSSGEFVFNVTDQGNFAYSVSLLKTIGSVSTFETGNRKTIVSNNITASQPTISNVKISPAIDRWNIIAWEIFGSIDQIDHFQVYGKWSGVERLLGCSFRSLKYIDTKLWRKAGTVTYRIVPIYLDFSNGESIEVSIDLNSTLPLLVRDNFELGQIALQEPVEKYFAPPETSTSPVTRNSRLAVVPGSSSSITNAFSSRVPLASISREIVPIDEIPKDNDFPNIGNFEILINKNDPQRSDPQLEGDFSTSSRSRSSSSSTKPKNLQRFSGKVNIPIVRKS